MMILSHSQSRVCDSSGVWFTGHLLFNAAPSAGAQGPSHSVSGCAWPFPPLIRSISRESLLNVQPSSLMVQLSGCIRKEVIEMEGTYKTMSCHVPYAHEWPSCVARKRISVGVFLLHPGRQETTSGFSLKRAYMRIGMNYYIVHKLQKVVIRGIYENISKGFWICWTSFEMSYTMTDCKLHERRDQECHMSQCRHRTHYSAWNVAGIRTHVLNKWMNNNTFFNFLFAWHK